jgi:hypothetical protein
METKAFPRQGDNLDARFHYESEGAVGRPLVHIGFREACGFEVRRTDIAIEPRDRQAARQALACRCRQGARVRGDDTTRSNGAARVMG